MKTRAAPLPISRDLHGDVLALNNAHAKELSWLEPGELEGEDERLVSPIEWLSSGRPSEVVAALAEEI